MPNPDPKVRAVNLPGTSSTLLGIFGRISLYVTDACGIKFHQSNREKWSKNKSQRRTLVALASAVKFSNSVCPDNRFEKIHLKLFNINVCVFSETVKKFHSFFEDFGVNKLHLKN